MAETDESIRRMVAAGDAPATVAAAILATGRSQIECLRVLRALYLCDLATAKRAMQDAQGVDPEAV